MPHLGPPTTTTTTLFDLTPEQAASLRTDRLRREHALKTLSSQPDLYRTFLETTFSRTQNTHNIDPLDATPIVLSVDSAITIRRPPWLIDNLVPSGGLCFLYGKEGVGKSFAALHIAFSVATGEPFLGSVPVRPGPVVYITAEGVYGLGNRVRGHLLHYPVAQPSSSIPLYLVPSAPQLNEPYGRTQLLLALRSILPDIPSLIIIDTFHACMASADENSSSDVGAFLAFANKLRQLSACTFLIIHHSRKTLQSGSNYRGHSSLAGAADTMILCKASSDALTLVCEKQKDFAPFPDETLKLKVVTLPPLVPGEPPDTTCVLVPAHQRVTAGALALSTLNRLGPSTGPAWLLAWVSDGGGTERSFYYAIKQLQADSLVLKRPDGTYVLNPSAPVVLTLPPCAHAPGEIAA